MNDAVSQFVKQYGLPGLLAVFMAWMYFNPSDQNTFRQDVMLQLQKCTEQISVLRAENETEFQTRRTMQLQLDAMQSQMLTFKSVQASLPWPAWTKDLSGTMVFANKAYEMAYLIPRGYTLRDYIGSDDYAVWPRDVAREFRENDAEVIRNGMWAVFKESVPVGPDGKMVELVYAKYPIYLAGTDTIVGVSGLSVPEHQSVSLGVQDPNDAGQWASAIVRWLVRNPLKNKQLSFQAVALSCKDVAY